MKIYIHINILNIIDSHEKYFILSQNFRHLSYRHKLWAKIIVDTL